MRHDRRIRPAVAYALPLAAALLTLSACSAGADPLGYPALPPAADLPPATAAATGYVDLADPDWLARTAQATGIPDVALAAYAAATITKNAEMPSCRLSWNTLAGIGFAESDHGRHDGSSLDENGTAVPPIHGVLLDGQGTEHIPDSDAGAIDGTAEGDRAVGPMQFIPEAWNNWHVDANRDGVEDPQNIFDAALASANYLCRAAGDVGTEEGWLAGISAYNPSLEYLNRVADAATRYASAVNP